MGPNSIMTNSAPSLSKDLGKKKRTNRLAKLKQCKFVAKREQWLSQVKNKGVKDEPIVRDCSPASLMDLVHEKDQTLTKDLETKSKGKDSNLYDSDLEDLTNSSTSSALEGHDSMKNHGTDSSTTSSSSSNSSSSFSGTFSEEEEEDGDDGCLDDWEAVADALAADEDKNPNPSPNSNPHSESDINLRVSNKDSEIHVLKQDFSEKAPKFEENCRAWRPDDAYRPLSLPNLSKQYSFPMNSVRHYSCGVVNWGCHPFISQPSSCPICCEDLDLTDTSFLPCLCGFRLCLFCHKRILENDGRCPGCRKAYDSGNGVASAGNGKNGGASQLRFVRSVSMNTGS